MTDLPKLLHDRLASAFEAVAGGPARSDISAGADPTIRRSDHADYQANGALRLAKQLGRNPREVATEILEQAGLGQANLDGLIAKAEIAGPGFINLTVTETALDTALEEMSTDERLGVPLAEKPERVLVDYSGPNVAKEMHVGHLRSTIIGDALVRVLEFLGHDVIRRNHLGDWGTPFGMLIEHLVDEGATGSADTLHVSDLNAFYQGAREKFDNVEGFADRARQRVVLLQGGDEQTLALWQILVDESKRHFEHAYELLDVRLTEDDYWGESAYNDMLVPVLEELTEKGLAQESEGAMVTFPKGFTGREDKPLPLILRKRDGGFNYDQTDLAAIRNRLLDLGAQRLVYITDLGQGLHFQMVFQAAREAGWLDEANGQSAQFDGFGLILGTDRQKIKSRSGDTPKLIDLLDEALARAEVVVNDKAARLPDDERQAVARAVGVGALKYADLSNDRIKDYIFDYDKMLSFEGNTAPYLQYAHARIQSVFRKGEIDHPSVRGAHIRIEHPAEHALAIQLGEFESVLRTASANVELHRIAGYLYELASAFTSFYEKCPVLKASDDRTKASRLALCEVTARVLATGLGLLGIDAPSRM